MYFFFLKALEIVSRRRPKFSLYEAVQFQTETRRLYITGRTWVDGRWTYGGLVYIHRVGTWHPESVAVEGVPEDDLTAVKDEIVA